MKKRRNQVIMTIVLVISLIFGLSIYGSHTNRQESEVQKPETSQQAQSSNQADGENQDESDEKNSKDSEDSEESDDPDRENEEEGSEEETSKEAEEGSQTAERTENETSSPEQEEGAEETAPSESSGQEVEEGTSGSKSASRPAENRQQAQSSGNSSQAGQGSPANEALPQETVQVTITTGPVRGGILSRSVPYKEGDTALDVSLRAMQAAGISYSLTGAGATAYMSGIDGLYEFDEGPLSGWKISVNGSDIDRSSGAYPVSAGSQVTWYYTTNYLED